MPLYGHLCPGLLYDGDQLLLVVLLRERMKVVLEKDEADDVLQQLDVGIGLQAPLAQKRSDALDGVIPVADVSKNVLRDVSVPPM